jgi:hypothetical protein
MPGIRRTAVLAAAFLLLSAAWATAQSSPAHVLPAGTAVVFVSDALLDVGRREGTAVPIHLRDPIVLDGTTIAAAGTRAELFIGGATQANGTRRPVVVLQQFRTTIGLLPVKPVQPIELPVKNAAVIEAVTEAAIDHIGARYSVRVPFPFGLNGDQPASYYTPTPARTAPPRLIVRPSPRVTTLPTPPPATPSPVPTVETTTLPTPAPTASP